MGWQKSGSGSRYFVTRQTRNGKTVTTYQGTGEAGRRAENEFLRLKLRRKLILLRFRLEEAIARYQEDLLLAIVENEQLNNGFIQRNRKWIPVQNLRRPLTQFEQDTISKAIEAKKTRKIPCREKNRLAGLQIIDTIRRIQGQFDALNEITSCNISETALTYSPSPDQTPNSPTNTLCRDHLRASHQAQNTGTHRGRNDDELNTAKISQSKAQKRRRKSKASCNPNKTALRTSSTPKKFNSTMHRNLVL
jgi:hypothetical protein